MGIDFNVNEFIKGKYGKVVGLVILIVILFLAFNGKHNKLPAGIETNIPIDTFTKSNRDSVPKVEVHSGDNVTVNGSGDYVKGDKNVITENIFSSQDYKPLKTRYETLFKSKTTDLIKKYPNHPTVIVDVESGNNNRVKVAMYIDSIMGINSLVSYPLGNTAVGQLGGLPIAINIRFSPKNFEFVKDFEWALNPYLHAQYTLDSSFRDDNYIKFYINGTPLFDGNGRVKIQ